MCYITIRFHCYQCFCFPTKDQRWFKNKSNFFFVLCKHSESTFWNGNHFYLFERLQNLILLDILYYKINANIFLFIQKKRKQRENIINFSLQTLFLYILNWNLVFACSLTMFLLSMYKHTRLPHTEKSFTKPICCWELLPATCC